MKSRIPTFRASGTGFGFLLLGLVGLAFALVATLLVGLLLAPVRLFLSRGRHGARHLRRDTGRKSPLEAAGPERAAAGTAEEIPLAGAVDVRYEEVS